jgi:hypothetical protein
MKIETVLILKKDQFICTHLTYFPETDTKNLHTFSVVPSIAIEFSKNVLFHYIIIFLISIGPQSFPQWLGQ